MIFKILVVLIPLAIFVVTLFINHKITPPEYSKEEDEICASCSNVLCKRSRKETKNCEELNDEQK